MTQTINTNEVAYKKPQWLRKKLTPHTQVEMENLLKDVGGLHTICQEAKCPNISECFSNKNATFLILGNICTRRCTYCNVTTGMPKKVDESEIKKVTTSGDRWNKDNGTTTYRYVTDSKGYVVQIYSKWESAQGKTDAEEKLECEIIYE